MPGVSRSLTPSCRLDSLPSSADWVGNGGGMLANITDIASTAIGSELPTRLYIILSCSCLCAFIGSFVNIDTTFSSILFYFSFIRDASITHKTSPKMEDFCMFPFLFF